MSSPLSKLSQTYDRLAYVHFSETYVTLRHAILYNRAVISQLAKGGALEDVLRDFRGNIGVIGASAYVDFAIASYPKAKIVPFPTWDVTIQALKAGKVDLVYRDEIPLTSAIAHRHLLHGSKGCIDLLLLRADVAASYIPHRHQAADLAILQDGQMTVASIRHQS